jgi:hypothetical protein
MELKINTYKFHVKEVLWINFDLIFDVLFFSTQQRKNVNKGECI